ncbi:hypothetical protein ABZW18_34455 [Streptomyces sp. NPDC004647]|uniref:hypothetical protein n=1 Tax=Streptomyces sp. NPDC004647 TaxID=3154671 RepID=UPI0033ABACE6
MGIATDTRRSTVAAADEMGKRLQDLQAAFLEMPGIEAFRLGWTVLVLDLLGQPEVRWPQGTVACPDRQKLHLEILKYCDR